jgi:hypothetical protein
MPDPDRKVDAWAGRVVSEAGSRHTLKVLEAMTHAIKKEFRHVAPATRKARRRLPRRWHSVPALAATLRL